MFQYINLTVLMIRPYNLKKKKKKTFNLPSGVEAIGERQSNKMRWGREKEEHCETTWTQCQERQKWHQNAKVNLNHSNKS